MNRKQRRDEVKKNKKAKQFTEEKKEQDINKSELYRLFKITIVVVIILFVLYLVVGIFVSKEIKLFDKKDVVEDNTTTNSVEKAILASETFKQKEEEYYVYFYDFDEEDSDIANIVTSRLSNYSVYRVNTNDVLNKNYVTEEDSNKDAKSLEDMQVKKNTLIMVENDNIVRYYEEDDIKLLR